MQQVVFSHVDVASLGGAEAVAAVGAPLAIGLPVGLDQHCRVRTIHNLGVVDASVMPTIPRANINLTCIMIGERVSDWMRAE